MTREGSNEFGGSTICHDDAAYVLGALSPADRRAYEQHLRECVACQASVRSLAGLPGLLALTAEDAVTGEDPSVPPSLLPGLVRRARRSRVRQRWTSGALAAAAVAVLAALVWVVARPVPVETTGQETGSATSTAAAVSSSPVSSPPAPSPSAAPDETVRLAAVLPGPMTATLELADRRWGTAITVVCAYDAAMTRSVAYDLAIVDTDGHETSAGSWSGIPGATSRIAAATAVPRERISAFEIRLPDGRTILSGAP